MDETWRQMSGMFCCFRMVGESSINPAAMTSSRWMGTSHSLVVCTRTLHGLCVARMTMKQVAHALLVPVNHQRTLCLLFVKHTFKHKYDSIHFHSFA